LTCCVFCSHPRAAHNISDIDKKKFLAPNEITVAKVRRRVLCACRNRLTRTLLGQFISEIRKHIKLGRQESLFVFVENNVMPVMTMGAFAPAPTDLIGSNPTQPWRKSMKDTKTPTDFCTWFSRGSWIGFHSFSRLFQMQ
jgi:hypothetical protein